MPFLFAQCGIAFSLSNNFLEERYNFLSLESQAAFLREVDVCCPLSMILDSSVILDEFRSMFVDTTFQLGYVFLIRGHAAARRTGS
jgi:hypothetical protein